jgi:hypothetical protein
MPCKFRGDLACRRPPPALWAAPLQRLLPATRPWAERPSWAQPHDHQCLARSSSQMVPRAHRFRSSLTSRRTPPPSARRRRPRLSRWIDDGKRPAREAKRGRLVIERTANKDYTTLQAIEDMRARCRVNAKASDCGSGRSGENEASSIRARPGSSATAQGISARDALRMKLQGPKNRVNRIADLRG